MLSFYTVNHKRRIEIIKAFLIDRYEHLIQIEKEKPSPGKKEVLIKVNTVGVCQTDMELFSGKMQSPGWQPPRIPGHEFSGVIAEIGNDVTGISVGDRVAVDPVVTCGECVYCRRGELGCLCGSLIGGSCDGALQEYVAVPAKNIIKIPDEMVFEEAALLEPVSCCYTAFYNIDVRPEHTVAILGPGMGGIILAQMCKTAGARVILTGTRPERLELGIRFGADIAVNIREQDPLEVIMKETGGFGADIVFECSASPDGVRSTVNITRMGGTIVLYSSPILPVDGFNFSRINTQNLKLVSGIGPWKASEGALSLIRQGKVRPSEMITHRFPAEKAVEVYDMVYHRKGGIFKAVLQWE
jgi:L-iditol 2-dehydrogenase